jgi:outer membrane protein TolC
LNYGRIANNVKVQDARFEQRVLQYQKTVLNAGRETEDSLIGFVETQVQARSLERGVQAAERSVELVLAQYRDGRVDFNRVFTTESQLVAQQDQLAAAQGNIALNLIAVYRSLGGGWRSFESDAPGCEVPHRRPRHGRAVATNIAPRTATLLPPITGSD